MESARIWGIPVGNGVVLAASLAHTIDALMRVAQLTLLVITIVYTTLQLIRARRRLIREESITDVLRRTSIRCSKAHEGECPLQSDLEKSQERE